MNIKDVILVFDDGTDPVHADDVFSIEGDHDSQKLSSLEAKVDTRELTLSFLGDMFPNMKKLRLNNSIIPSVRDIGCTLVNLRFLSLARCGISSLDGISTLSQNLEELYLAFNNITDVCDLMGMDKLKIIDLEDNKIEKIENIEILSLCQGLKALTLDGNPAATIANYRERVIELLPQLVYLDEKRLKPKRPKTPKPPLPTKGSASKLAPRAKHVEVVTEPEISVPAPAPASVPEPEPIPVPEIKKLTPEEIEDREQIMTEMLDDLVDDRPPTSRGYYGEAAAFPGFGKSLGNSRGKPLGRSQKLLSPNVPRIIRPVSAKGRNPL